MSNSFNRLRALMSKLSNIARKSEINHQHAAVIIRNGNPVAWGINSIKGNNTCHAECDAIRKYLLSSCKTGYAREHRSLLWNQYRYQKR